MRSRPKIRVFLTPRAPIAGDEVRADLELVSRSETPVDGITLRLVGEERRHSGTSMAGNVPVAHYAVHRHVDLVAKLPAETLREGVHIKRVSFQLPSDAPPLHRAQASSITWELSVHVDIPWWPDRRAAFEMEVRTPPLRDVVVRPHTFANARGPQGKELYLEASIDRTVIALDDVVSGAVSVSNVRFHRVESVVVACVAYDRPVGASAVGAREITRLETIVHRGAPEEGAALPFRFRFPSSAPCTFTAKCIAVDWRFEVRAVLSFSRDVTMSTPVVVGRAAKGAEREAARNRPVLPVGRDRRAILFAEAARRTGFDHEAGEERLARAIDGATIEIVVEHRGADGPWLVAKVVHASLGIDLHVGDRRWFDALRGDVVDLQGAFADRFRVSVREPAQGEAYVDEQVRAAALSFRDATLDDHGARFCDPGAGHSVEELQGFAAKALVAARALTEAARNVPPPTAMKEHAPAWRAFADAYGGRLVVGGMSVHEATIDRERVEVTTLWDDQTPTRTRLRIAAPGQSDESRKEHAAAIDALRALAGDVELEGDAIVATIDGACADPSTLLPTLQKGAELARLLRGEREAGPYR